MGIKRDSFWVLLTSCLLGLVEIGIEITIARTLGPDGRGQFAICWSFLNILMMIGVFGVHDANTYYLASSKLTISQVFWTSICIGVLGSLIIGFGAYRVIHLPLDFFSKASRTEFLLSIIAMCPFVLSLYLVAILRGTFSYKAMNVIKLLGPTMALIAIYVLCYQFKLGVKGAMIGRIIGAISIIIFTAARLRKHLFFKDFLKGFKLIPSILHYALRACFGFFAQRMSAQIGVLVVACFLAPAEVGFYAIAIAMVTRIQVMPNALRLVLMPKLAQLNAIDGVLVSRSLRIMIPIVMILAVGLGVICKPFIKYGMGKQFMPALLPVYLLLICGVLKSASELVTTYLYGINRPGISSSIRILGVFVSIVFLWFFVRAYGLIGGCIATVISCMLETLVMLLVFIRMSGVKSWRLLVLQKSDIAYLWNSVSSLVVPFRK
jgi:O-antigen/teichoic acid export membrane protein